MSDEALIRLDNLKALNLTPTQLSARVGGRYTYWRDLLANKKSFGEKIARKIEEKLELRRGALDEAGSLQGVTPAIPAPTPPEPAPDELAAALSLIAGAIAKADRLTRIQLEPLLALLAKEPDENVKISHLIHGLLVNVATPPQSSDDPVSGWRGATLPTGGMKSDGKRSGLQKGHKSR